MQSIDLFFQGSTTVAYIHAQTQAGVKDTQRKKFEIFIKRAELQKFQAFLFKLRTNLVQPLLVFT
jgi:hypothetical protein